MTDTELEERFRRNWYGEDEIDRRIRLILDDPAAKQERLDREAKEVEWIEAAFATFGTGEALPTPPVHMQPRIIDRQRPATSAGPLREHEPRQRTRDGLLWDLMPPGTDIQAGDLDDEEGLWRPRKTLSRCETRYDRAVMQRLQAEADHDAALAAFGADDPHTIAAHRQLDQAQIAQHQALKDADNPVTQDVSASTTCVRPMVGKNTMLRAARSGLQATLIY